MEPAHTMDASARRGGRRAKKHTGNRRPIRVWAENRPNSQLPQCGCAAIDVSADTIRVRPFDIGAVPNGTRQNAVPKPRGESFNLRLNQGRGICARPMWHVAIGPQHVFACRRARRIEKALLREQHEWPLGQFAFPSLTFSARDFIKRSAQVDCPRASTLGRSPRNWRTESIIELEHAGTVSIAAELLFV